MLDLSPQAALHLPERPQRWGPSLDVILTDVVEDREDPASAAEKIAKAGNTGSPGFSLNHQLARLRPPSLIAQAVQCALTCIGPKTEQTMSKRIDAARKVILVEKGLLNFLCCATQRATTLAAVARALFHHSQPLHRATRPSSSGRSGQQSSSTAAAAAAAPAPTAAGNKAPSTAAPDFAHDTCPECPAWQLSSGAADLVFNLLVKLAANNSSWLLTELQQAQEEGPQLLEALVSCVGSSPIARTLEALMGAAGEEAALSTYTVQQITPALSPCVPMLITIVSDQGPCPPRTALGAASVLLTLAAEESASSYRIAMATTLAQDQHLLTQFLSTLMSHSSSAARQHRQDTAIPSQHSVLMCSHMLDTLTYLLAMGGTGVLPQRAYSATSAPPPHSSAAGPGHSSQNGVTFSVRSAAESAAAAQLATALAGNRSVLTLLQQLLRPAIQLASHTCSAGGGTSVVHAAGAGPPDEEMPDSQPQITTVKGTAVAEYQGPLLLPQDHLWAQKTQELQQQGHQQHCHEPDLPQRQHLHLHHDHHHQQQQVQQQQGQGQGQQRLKQPTLSVGDKRPLPCSPASSPPMYHSATVPPSLRDLSLQPLEHRSPSADQVLPLSAEALSSSLGALLNTDPLRTPLTTVIGTAEGPTLAQGCGTSTITTGPSASPAAAEPSGQPTTLRTGTPAPALQTVSQPIPLIPGVHTSYGARLIPLGSHILAGTRLIGTMTSRVELQPCVISSGAWPALLHLATLRPFHNALHACVLAALRAALVHGELPLLRHLLVDAKLLRWLADTPRLLPRLPGPATAAPDVAAATESPRGIRATATAAGAGTQEAGASTQQPAEGLGRGAGQVNGGGDVEDNDDAVSSRPAPAPAAAPPGASAQAAAGTVSATGAGSHVNHGTYQTHSPPDSIRAGYCGLLLSAVIACRDALVNSAQAAADERASMQAHLAHQPAGGPGALRSQDTLSAVDVLAHLKELKDTQHQQGGGSGNTTSPGGREGSNRAEHRHTPECASPGLATLGSTAQQQQQQQGAVLGQSSTGAAALTLGSAEGAGPAAAAAATAMDASPPAGSAPPGCAAPQQPSPGRQSVTVEDFKEAEDVVMAEVTQSSGFGHTGHTPPPATSHNLLSHPETPVTPSDHVSNSSHVPVLPAGQRLTPDTPATPEANQVALTSAATPGGSTQQPGAGGSSHNLTPHPVTTQRRSGGSTPQVTGPISPDKALMASSPNAAAGSPLGIRRSSSPVRPTVKVVIPNSTATGLVSHAISPGSSNGSGSSNEGSPECSPRGSSPRSRAEEQGGDAGAGRLLSSPPKYCGSPKHSSSRGSVEARQAGSATPPPISTALPTSSTALPTSSTALPTSSTALPTSSTALPTSSTTPPPISTALPTSSTGDNSAPSQAAYAVAAGDTVITNGDRGNSPGGRERLSSEHLREGRAASSQEEHESEQAGVSHGQPAAVEEHHNAPATVDSMQVDTVGSTPAGPDEPLNPSSGCGVVPPGGVVTINDSAPADGFHSVSGAADTATGAALSGPVDAEPNQLDARPAAPSSPDGSEAPVFSFTFGAVQGSGHSPIGTSQHYNGTTAMQSSTSAEPVQYTAVHRHQLWTEAVSDLGPTRWAVLIQEALEATTRGRLAWRCGPPAGAGGASTGGGAGAAGGGAGLGGAGSGPGQAGGGKQAEPPSQDGQPAPQQSPAGVKSNGSSPTGSAAGLLSPRIGAAGVPSSSSPVVSPRTTGNSNAGPPQPSATASGSGGARGSSKLGRGGGATTVAGVLKNSSAGGRAAGSEGVKSHFWVGSPPYGSGSGNDFSAPRNSPFSFCSPSYGSGNRRSILGSGWQQPEEDEVFENVDEDDDSMINDDSLLIETDMGAALIPDADEGHTAGHTTGHTTGAGHTTAGRDGARSRQSERGGVPNNSLPGGGGGGGGGGGDGQNGASQHPHSSSRSHGTHAGQASGAQGPPQGRGNPEKSDQLQLRKCDASSDSDSEGDDTRADQSSGHGRSRGVRAGGNSSSLQHSGRGPAVQSSPCTAVTAPVAMYSSRDPRVTYAGAVRAGVHAAHHDPHGAGDMERDHDADADLEQEEEEWHAGRGVHGASTVQQLLSSHSHQQAGRHAGTSGSPHQPHGSHGDNPHDLDYDLDHPPPSQSRTRPSSVQAQRSRVAMYLEYPGGHQTQHHHQHHQHHDNQHPSYGNLHQYHHDNQLSGQAHHQGHLSPQQRQQYGHNQQYGAHRTTQHQGQQLGHLGAQYSPNSHHQQLHYHQQHHPEDLDHQHSHRHHPHHLPQQHAQQNPHLVQQQPGPPAFRSIRRFEGSFSLPAAPPPSQLPFPQTLSPKPLAAPSSSPADQTLPRTQVAPPVPPPPPPPPPRSALARVHSARNQLGMGAGQEGGVAGSGTGGGPGGGIVNTRTSGALGGAQEAGGGAGVNAHHTEQQQGGWQQSGGWVSRWQRPASVTSDPHGHTHVHSHHHTSPSNNPPATSNPSGVQQAPGQQQASLHQQHHQTGQHTHATAAEFPLSDQDHPHGPPTTSHQSRWVHFVPLFDNLGEEEQEDALIPEEQDEGRGEEEQSVGAANAGPEVENHEDQGGDEMNLPAQQAPFQPRQAQAQLMGAPAQDAAPQLPSQPPPPPPPPFASQSNAAASTVLTHHTSHFHSHSGWGVTREAESPAEEMDSQEEGASQEEHRGSQDPSSQEQAHSQGEDAGGVCAFAAWERVRQLVAGEASPLLENTTPAAIAADQVAGGAGEVLEPEVPAVNQHPGNTPAPGSAVQVQPAAEGAGQMGADEHGASEGGGDVEMLGA